MPGRDITRRLSDWALRILLPLTLVISAGTLVSVPAQSPAANGSKPATPTPPAQQQQQPDQPTDENGVFVIRKDVDEVLLHATVIDDKQHLVTNLDRTAFTVFEDGKQQNIISFHHE